MTSGGLHDAVEAAADADHDVSWRVTVLDVTTGSVLAQRDPERYLVLDARASREEIAADVAARVAPLLSPARH